MTLPAWPPPQPTLPSSSRYPANFEDPGSTATIGQGYYYIFGRNGNPPPPALEADIISAIDDRWPDDPLASPLATWLAVYWWSWYIGTATPFGDLTPLLSIEIRTPAEVTAAAGPGAPPIVFAETGWDDNPAFPAHDGMTSFGASPGDPAWFDAGQRWIRVLIRDDLVSGGAGAEWAGDAFFIECIAHELGHASMFLLEQNYGASFVHTNLCDIFGKPTTAWDNPSDAWEDRVAEMAAESFKDMVYPGRVYDNRTNGELAEARFEDFRLLMTELVENVWWSIDNTGDLRYRENSFFFNLGSASFVHQQNTQLTYVVNRESIPQAQNIVGRSYPDALAWDGSDIPDGGLYINWNWDSVGEANDPGPDTTAHGGGRWDSIMGTDDAAPGDPFYDFSFAGFTGDPENHVRPGFIVDFWDLATNFSHSGTYYGSWWLWLAPDPGATDAEKRAFIPPVSGRVKVDFAQVYSGYSLPGEPLGTHVTLPTEGFTAWPRFLASGPMPKYTMYPSEPRSFLDDAMGLSITWPWYELIGERIHFSQRGIVFADRVIPTNIRATPGDPSTLRLQKQRLVQLNGPVTISPFVPN